MQASTTIWLSPTDFVSGDPTLQISYPFVSHQNTTVTCTTPGDLKWVSMGLRLPENVKIEEIIVCYQVSNPNSFISQIRLTEMKTPDKAIVIHDDGTDLQSTTPICYTSQVGGKIPSDNAAVTLALRLNFQNANDKIMLGAVGVKIHSTEKQCVNTIAELRALSINEEASSCIELLGYHAPGDGGGGIFFWDSSFNIDLNLFPNGEDGGTVIKPNMIQPSQSGRWRRIPFDGHISVKWFGAKGDGNSHPLSERYANFDEAKANYPQAISQDDQIAWADLEIDWAAIQTSIKKGGSSSIIRIPCGTYVLNRPLILSNINGFAIEGDGQGVTILETTSATDDCIVITEGSSITIRNLDIYPKIQRCDGKYINAANVKAKLWIENVRMISPYDGIYATGCSLDITNLRVYSANDAWKWHSAIYMQSCISSMLDRVSITMGTTEVTLGAVVFESGCDTIYVLNSEVVQVGGTLGTSTQGGVCFLFDHTADCTSHPPNWIRLISCDAESLGKQGILINHVNQIDIISPQIQASLNGIKITGGNGISVRDGFIINTWEHGILITGGTDISIRGTRVTGASQHTAGEYDQILVDGIGIGIENVRIEHCLIGDNHTLVLPSGPSGLHARFGINANKLSDTTNNISDTTVGVFGPNTFGPNQNVNINNIVPYAVYLEQVYTEAPTAPIAGTWAKGDYVLTTADEDKASFVRCTATGKPGTWIAGGIVGPKRIGEYQKTAPDAFPTDTLAETIVDTSRGNDTTIKVEFIPNSSLISNDDDYATLTVYKRDANGTNQVEVIAQACTKKSESGGTGNWTAFKAVDLGTINNGNLGVGELLTFEITKTGGGAIVPSGRLIVTRRLG